jgi:hypothetical protein
MPIGDALLDYDCIIRLTEAQGVLLEKVVFKAILDNQEFSKQLQIQTAKDL